ncbi:hypothetical protein V1478_003942 [Vespula squamosa]|uniref:Uncharacterized protein n=1 Tax=Vespula squamosa TaxID=30214 RepID=A0ABD2BN96_VESSQ
MECLPIACAYKYLYIKAHVYRSILRHEIIRYVKFACVQNKNMHIKMCTCTALILNSSCSTKTVHPVSIRIIID